MTGNTVPEDITADEPAVSWSVSPGLSRFLDRHHLSIAVTSYQSGRLYLIGRDPNGGVHINERIFTQAMGLTGNRNELWLATHHQIYRFANPLKPGEIANNTFDVLYIPREVLVTGALDAHDIGLGQDGRPIFVNTRWSCLAVPSHTHSFKPVWRPPFISHLAAEDRCHLNGLAMDNGDAAFVTAIAQSDAADGWRHQRHDGGVVIDVRRNAVILASLSMPHSPRLHDGRLWILNSGTGHLGHIDPAAQQPAFTPLAFCPGFARGLAFHGRHAFIGLSKPRYERFEGLDLDQRLRESGSEAYCGVQIIDIDQGAVVEWIRLEGAVTELYDIAVLPDVTAAMSLGLHNDEIAGLITVEETPSTQ